MSRTIQSLLVGVLVFAVAAYGGVKWERGKLQAYEVMLSYEFQLQARLDKCVASRDIACVEHEVAAFRQETESFVSYLEERGVSERMRASIAAYRQSSRAASVSSEGG